MTRVAHIQPLPAWPTTPGISSAVPTAPLLLEEKGLGDEVDATKNGLGDEVDATKKGPGVALSEVEADEVDWPPEQRSFTEYYTPHTFSAKERDLKTGYSYFGARYYYAGLSIWLSVDPLSDKYPSMSAYMYCAGNPVMLVDPDGLYIIGTDGNAISYQRGSAGEIIWSDNTSADVRRIGDILLSSHTGSEVFEKAMATRYPISLAISEESPGSLGIAAVTADIHSDNESHQVYSVAITIFRGEICDMFLNVTEAGVSYSGVDGELVGESFVRTMNEEIVLAAVAVHEFVHATDPTNIMQQLSNNYRGTNYDIEKLPTERSNTFLIEMLPVNKQQPIIVKAIPTLDQLQ